MKRLLLLIYIICLTLTPIAVFSEKLDVGTDWSNTVKNITTTGIVTANKVIATEFSFPDGFEVPDQPGATTTFVTFDNKRITVVQGIITLTEDL